MGYIPNQDYLSVDVLTKATLLTQKSIHSRRYNNFLEGIVSARRAAGFTQQELARKLRRPQSYVSKYERGERRLDVLEFVEVARALSTDPCVLLEHLEAGGGRQ